MGGVAMASGVAEACPRCSEPRTGLFCEQCGHSTPLRHCPSRPHGAPSSPRIEITSRPVLRTSSSSPFQRQSPARHIPLIGASVRVGRRSASRGTIPEIDLADPPADPGVSREHARLVCQPDGTWAVIDEASTNGTYLNGSRQRLPAHQLVPLSHGDRVHLGVWTTITLRRDP